MWLEYLRPTPATEDDICRTEERLGIVFPDAFLGFFTKRQGMTSETALVVDEKGRSRRVGPLFFFTAVESEEPNLSDLCLFWRRGGYPRGLVPFAWAGNQPHFALDFRASTSSPSVVYVHPDGDAVDTGYWASSAVAPSVEAFLAMLDKTGDA